MKSTPNLMLKIDLGRGFGTQVQPASRIKIERGYLMIYDGSSIVHTRIPLNRIRQLSIDFLSGERQPVPAKRVSGTATGVAARASVADAR